MAGKTQTPVIHFHFEKVSLTLKNRRKLKAFLSHVINKENKNLHSLNYIFCSDNALLTINRKYLNHSFYTDVITFNLSSSPAEILADVYISVDRVKENAKDLRVLVEEELHRVIFHGLLHLCGYNDKTESQRTQMRKKEAHYLELYFTRFT